MNAIVELLRGIQRACFQRKNFTSQNLILKGSAAGSFTGHRHGLMLLRCFKRANFKIHKKVSVVFPDTEIKIFSVNFFSYSDFVGFGFHRKPDLSMDSRHYQRDG